MSDGEQHSWNDGVPYPEADIARIMLPQQERYDAQEKFVDCLRITSENHSLEAILYVFAGAPGMREGLLDVRLNGQNVRKRIVFNVGLSRQEVLDLAARQLHRTIEEIVAELIGARFTASKEVKS